MPVEVLAEVEVVEETADEHDASALAAHRAVAEPGHAILVAADGLVEVGYHAARLVLARAHEDPDEEVAELLGGREIVDAVVAQEPGELDLAPGHEPSGKMVAPRVEEDALWRHFVEEGDELVDIARLGDLACPGCR